MTSFWMVLHQWPWMTLNLSRKRVLVFFCNFRLQRTFQEWIAPKWLEIDLDNMRVKFVDRTHIFDHISFDLLNSKSLPHEGLKCRYSLKTQSLLFYCTLYTDCPAGGSTAAVALYVNFVQITCSSKRYLRCRNLVPYFWRNNINMCKFISHNWCMFYVYWFADSVEYSSSSGAGLLLLLLLLLQYNSTYVCYTDFIKHSSSRGCGSSVACCTAISKRRRTRE